MCFSATASFGASGVLLVIGTASIIKAVGIRQLPFAVVPLLFAVQQFTEGFLWLAAEEQSPGNKDILAQTYVFFAQVLWPVWIPIAFLWLEKEVKRKLMLKGLIGAGFLVGGYLAYCLFTYEVKAEITGHHIKYILDYPRPLRGYGNVLYGLATVVPAFVSGVRGMKIFGLLIVMAYMVSFFYFWDVLISVWCYFAALISISIWYLIPNSSEAKAVSFKPYQKD